MAYTYLIGWPDLGKWYYGVRYAKGAEPSELWKTYFTSSKHVEKFREEFGDPSVIQVRREFLDVDSARKWESTVLKRMKVTRREDFLNHTDNMSISLAALQKGARFYSDGKNGPHPNKGQKRPGTSERNKLKIGPLNPMWGKTGALAPCYGRVGELHPMFGKPMPKAVYDAFHKKITCPHCDKIGSYSNMKRWHFDNCKQKEENNKENTNAIMA